MTRRGDVETGVDRAEALVLDEAFLARVDRAMLASKLDDPYRMDQVDRATEAQERMTHFSAQSVFDKSRPAGNDC